MWKVVAEIDLNSNFGRQNARIQNLYNFYGCYIINIEGYRAAEILVVSGRMMHFQLLMNLRSQSSIWKLSKFPWSICLQFIEVLR